MKPKWNLFGTTHHPERHKNLLSPLFKWCPYTEVGSARRRWPNALTPQNSAIVRIQFLQQAYFGLRFGLRWIPPTSATSLYPGIVCKPEPRLGFWEVSISRNIPRMARLTVSHIQGGGDCLCILLIRGVGLYIITPSSLKKRDNSVGSVGSVGKS